jgi:hypothetical protein
VPGRLLIRVRDRPGAGGSRTGHVEHRAHMIIIAATARVRALS